MSDSGAGTETGNSTEEPSATGETPATEAPSGEAGEAHGLTVERVLDMTLGAAVVAVETARRTAEQIRQNAPGVVETLEEKGRPLREQILGKLGSASAWTANIRSTTAETAASADTATVTAEDEISALERRVRELEAQVAAGNTGDATTAAPQVPETTAEEATVEAGETRASLAASPYAMSETDEEVAREAEDATSGGGVNESVAEDEPTIGGVAPEPEGVEGKKPRRTKKDGEESA